MSLRRPGVPPVRAGSKEVAQDTWVTLLRLLLPQLLKYITHTKTCNSRNAHLLEVVMSCSRLISAAPSGHPNQSDLSVVWT